VGSSLRSLNPPYENCSRCRVKRIRRPRESGTQTVLMKKALDSRFRGKDGENRGQGRSYLPSASTEPHKNIAALGEVEIAIARMVHARAGNERAAPDFAMVIKPGRGVVLIWIR
jgi:hypothetical protein